jgi:hypothetical protein
VIILSGPQNVGWPVPAVDLSVRGLLIGIRHLSMAGAPAASSARPGFC